MKTNKKTNMMLRSVLAGALVFGTSSVTVFADEQSQTTDETEVVAEVITQVNSEQETGVSTDESTNTTIELEADVKSESKGKKSPLLVPGDFFYFVKVVYEKIQFAVSSNDFERAKVLAAFAEERIAEANVLIQAGKTELAEKNLQDALAHQLLALELTEATTDLEASTETEVAVETEESTTIEATSTEDEIVVEAIEEIEVDAEVRAKIANNIEALLMVLGKIDNPRAQEAIMKNIEKSFKKMENGIDKLEKTSQHKASVETEAETDTEAVVNAEQEEATEVATETEGKSESTLKAKQNKQNEENKAELKSDKKSEKAESKSAQQDQKENKASVNVETKVEVKAGLGVGKEKQND